MSVQAGVVWLLVPNTKVGLRLARKTAISACTDAAAFVIISAVVHHPATAPGNNTLPVRMDTSARPQVHQHMPLLTDRVKYPHLSIPDDHHLATELGHILFKSSQHVLLTVKAQRLQQGTTQAAGE